MDTKTIILNGAKILLGTLMIIFGLNKFLGFIPVEPPSDQTAQMFLGAMFSSYLFKAVALAEIAGGIMLFIPKVAFAGMLLLLPVMFNIVVFHFAHDMPGNGIWLAPTILFIGVFISFRDKTKNLIA
ncbi:hypothetical protein [Ekhidna sp.]